MSKAMWRLPLRLLAVIFGISLFVYLVHRAGPTNLLESMVTLGWGLVLVLAWGGVAHVLKTWSWRITLLDEKRHVSFPRMLGLRLASEAVGQFGGLGQMIGEGVRVSLLGSALPVASGFASVTIDRALFIISAAIVSIVGLLAVLIVLPLPHALALYGRVAIFVLLGVIALSAVAVRKRWCILSRPAEILGRHRYFSGWISRKRSLIYSVEKKLLDFYHYTRGFFWASFLLNLACHMSAVFEVFLILWLLRAKVSLFGALAIEALTKLVNIVGTFNPGNLGTYEGGNMLIVKMFGLTAATGLTLAFIRRLRALFWAAVGGLCIIGLSKPKKESTMVEVTEDVMQIESELKKEARESETGRRSNVAVILANNIGGFGSASPLPAVGALAIILRNILGAQKAGAERIVVVVDRAKSPWLHDELVQTNRLPRNTEWCNFTSKESPLPALLGQLASEISGHIVLISGDAVYHPSLFKRAVEWDGESGALAFTTGGEFTGICAFSREMALGIASRPLGAKSMDPPLDWPSSIEVEQVPADKWQRILNEQQRKSAEKKLDSWLVKPTDGIFARANRKISIPISRQLIRFPITPNMVSLFTLGVSFAAGAFLGFGGYWNMLTGAVLSWLASVLDGCDGEVARLKLQESAFGCWLETVCDNLYYLFIFAGMTIGVVRSSGNRSYLVWGAFLVCGAIASFLTTGLQRHRMTSGRPEQYLGMWHRQAESRGSNPFLFLGRHTEFIIRRCFLPYVFLFFAVFHIMNWLLIAATLGANLFWIIALYSHLTFSSARPSAAPSSA